MIPGSASPFFLGSSLAVGGGAGYQVERSLRFNSSDSGFCSRTPAVAGSRTTWTWAAWVKRSGLGAGFGPLFATPTGVDDTTLFNLLFYDDTIYIAGSATGWRRTSAVFRDSSAWYHILVSVDTNQTTANNRIRLYVNGTEVTAFSTLNNPSQGASLGINNTSLHTIGNYATDYFSGYLADIHFIDGQALTPSSFTEVSATTGQLIPLAYSGTFGTNGFWLKFSDNSALTSGSNVGVGKDYSGNANYFNTSGLSVTAGAGNDSLVDTPTSYGTDTGVGGEVRGNYATFNAIEKAALGGAATLANGNLDMQGGATEQFRAATIPVSSGKWYFEIVQSTGADFGPGVWPYPLTSPSSQFYQNTNYRYNSGGGVYNAGGLLINYSSFTTGDIIGTALDLDNGKVYFSKNGVFQNSSNPVNGTNPVATGLTGTWVFGASTNPGGTTLSANFGQRPFAYTAPSGFKALCDTNLPAPLVAKPNTVMDVALYNGNGAANTITGLAFSPDLVWMKVRSTAYNHTLIDSVRGATKTLSSSMTVQEYTEPTGPTAFTADGWSMSGDVTYVGSVNASGQTYVAWAWDAGTSTVSNTAGSITSQVRANASAGFSIVAFNTGSAGNKTIGHGLGVAPQMIIFKNRVTAPTLWAVYHVGQSSPAYQYYLRLNGTNAQTADTNIWANTAPSSTVFSIESGYITNASNDCIAYCFAPVVGYSSFGSYTGGTQGTFVYLGFTPKWLLVKSATGSVGDNWKIYDSSRSSYNVRSDFLAPNTSGVETTGNLNQFDFVSNGFVVRTNPAYDTNNSGITYIYAAFAENPFQYARAR